MHGVYKAGLAPVRRAIRSAKRAILALVYRKQIAAVTQVLNAEPFTPILRASPAIATKPTRSYLRSSLSASARAQAIVGHYRAASQLLSDEGLIATHVDQVRLLTRPSEWGDITVELGWQSGLYREGEWRLLLRLSGRQAFEMSLSIVDARLVTIALTGDVLWIGALKACHAETGLEDARLLTKELEGIRPKSLLLFIAQTLARHFGLTGILAASNKGHVFNGHPGLRRRIKADYVRFWIESGGTSVNARTFSLPLSRPTRDISEYKPNKRSQARRRKALEEELEASVAQSLSTIARCQRVASREPGDLPV